MKTGRLSVTSDCWPRHGVNRTSASDPFPPRFSAAKYTACNAAFILRFFLPIFPRLFHAKKRQQKPDKGRMLPAIHPPLGRLPKTVLALDHVQVPPQLFAANHGRRYVFSQPILDHICLGNASHLEHSRPGARGRHATPAVDTTTWHSETPPLPQSRSSIARSKKVHFCIASQKNALRLQLLPTVKVCE